VEDLGSGNILVADISGRVSYVIDSTGVLGANTLSGLGAITDGPLLDGSTEKAFVFSGGNGTSAIVEEADTLLTATSVVTLNIGNNSAATHVHMGTFDNNYYNSIDGTGNLYVCGKQAAHAAPALYDISIVSGVMTTVAAGPLDLSTTTAAQECSPLTEFYNPNEGGSGTDWLFLGVPSNCAFGGASTGCVLSFDITSGMPSAAFATASANGGTSGIIPDNVSTTGQTSSVYFTTLVSPGAGGCDNEPATDSTTCLVKRTQAGLQ